MNHAQTESFQPAQHSKELIIQQKYIQNPRKAATKLKEVISNVETMKKRFKVLQVQDDYNRYKTIDHQKRINQHVQIHSRILKERQFLKKSLEKVKDTTQVKEQTDQIRSEIKEKIKEARKSLMTQRLQRANNINQQFVQNTLLIKEKREKQAEENREKSLTVKFEEEKKRQSVSRHIQQKVKSIRLNKSIDSSSLTKQATKKQEQLSRLMMYEQQLIKKGSQSLQASQLMKHKFNEVFTTVSSNNSRLLPQIRARTNNSKYTSNSNSTQV